MTSGDATAACLGLEIIERYIDSSEHEALAEVVILVGGVDIVAGAAGSPLLVINVQLVEINVTVPEISYCVRLFFCNQRLLVTVKTEVVLALLIRGIELMRELKPQDKRIIRAVRIVACAAVALYHRAVLKTPLLPELFILVTLETEGVDLILQ